jgi:GTP-dependent phosphoenolpyruvate carboxykinase
MSSASFTLLRQEHTQPNKVNHLARGRAISIESPLGRMPRYEELDWRGTEHCPREQFTALMTVSRAIWQQEVRSHERYSSG